MSDAVNQAIGLLGIWQSHLDTGGKDLRDRIEKVRVGLRENLATDPAQPFTEPGQRRWSRVLEVMGEQMDAVIRAYDGPSEDYGKACIDFDDALVVELDRVSGAPARGVSPTAHLSAYEDADSTGNEGVTQAQINAGPHAGLGTVPSDYSVCSRCLGYGEVNFRPCQQCRLDGVKENDRG